jgi:hypothetical protein
VADLVGEPVEGHDPAVVVLARMPARQHAQVPVGQKVVVLGWGRDIDGRKGYPESSIENADGTVVAVADSLWIQPGLSAQPR